MATQKPKGDKEKDTVVDARFLSRRVWLVRIPNFLADALENADEEQEIGTLNIATESVQGRKRQKLTFNFKTENPELPVDFDFFAADAPADDKGKQPGPAPPESTKAVAAVFSENTTAEGSLAFEGHINKRWDLRPRDSEVYRALNKKRSLKSQERHSIMVTDETVRHFKPTAGLREQREMRRKEGTHKREKLEKAELTEKIFLAFERHQFYSIGGLEEVLDQPQAHIKETLRDLAVCVSRGPNKGKWELRSEYKTKTARGIEGSDAQSDGDA